MAARFFDYDGSFFRGCFSSLSPGQVPLGYFWNAINMINTGGVLSCRPGYRCVATLPSGNLQGATIFRPELGLEQLVFAIDGKIFVSDFPFREFRLLPNVLMDATAKQVFWCQTQQSANRLDHTETSAIELIPPKPVLFIQDGGFTAPAWYDGSQSGHVRDFSFETPTGSSMMWIGDRLWVANGILLKASDIANPFSFRETLYLGGTDALTFSEEITALGITPDLEAPQLLVWTANNCSLVQAAIRDRSTWQTTPQFQVEIFKVGNTSQRSVVSHFGQLFWMSPAGFTSWDAAVASKKESRLPMRDSEMSVSKQVLYKDWSLVAGAAFGSFVFMSVPAEDVYNKHTWVLNNASLETLVDDSGPSWNGYWLGTRPVEWVYGSISGAERIYHVSLDDDGENRLWEAMRPERLDNNCPITWAVETRAYFGATSQCGKPPGLDCRMCYADINLVAIGDTLDFGVWYAGGLRGAFKRLMTKRINVARGTIRSGEPFTAQTNIFALKPQVRQLRTEDARGKGVQDETGSCPPESEKLEDFSDSFQLLVVGQGPATIQWIRAFSLPRLEDQSGDPKACEPETTENAVRFDGAGASGDTVVGAEASIPPGQTEKFESIQTATITQKGHSALGVGTATSIISQDAADRVALRVARQLAAVELANSLAPVFSFGKGFS